MHAAALWDLHKSFAQRVAAGVEEERMAAELAMPAAAVRLLRAGLLRSTFEGSGARVSPASSPPTRAPVPLSRGDATP